MVHETRDRRTAALAALAEDFELADVYVFGSRAIGDLEGVRDALLEWIRANPERIDRPI